MGARVLAATQTARKERRTNLGHLEAEVGKVVGGRRAVAGSALWARGQRSLDAAAAAAAAASSTGSTTASVERASGPSSSSSSGIELDLSDTSLLPLHRARPLHEIGRAWPGLAPPWLEEGLDCGSCPPMPGAKCARPAPRRTTPADAADVPQTGLDWLDRTDVVPTKDDAVLLLLLP
jgi:hypothetical protein